MPAPKDPTKYGDWVKGISRGHTGLKQTTLTKEKRSQSLKKVGHKPPTLSGPDNAHWKGGSHGYWTRQAKTRDDYTCQICGLRDTEIMEVDHIIPKSVRPDLRFELTNLMTLCPNCHRRKTNREKRNKIYSH
jgi:5-methylcytosine-specific restriction endonuclease McrA